MLISKFIAFKSPTTHIQTLVSIKKMQHIQHIPIIKLNFIGKWGLILIITSLILLTASIFQEEKIGSTFRIDGTLITSSLFSIFLSTGIAMRFIQTDKKIGHLQIFDQTLNLEINGISTSIPSNEVYFNLSSYKNQTNFSFSRFYAVSLWENGTGNYIKCKIDGKIKKMELLIENEKILIQLRRIETEHKL